MGEEAFEETRLVSSWGTVIVRGNYGHRSTWIGLSRRRNNDDNPDVIVELSPRMVLRLIATLAEMTLTGDEDGNPPAKPGEPIGECHCPNCGAELEVEHGDEPGQIAVVGCVACQCTDPECPDDTLSTVRQALRELAPPAADPESAEKVMVLFDALKDALKGSKS